MNNAEIIWNYLRQYFNEYATAGIMGNLYYESSLNSKNLQGTYEKKLNMTDESYTKAVDNKTYTNFIKDSAGYGLAQWTYWSRKQNLYNFAQQQKTSIGDLQMQLAFLVKELTENYKTSCDTPLKTVTSVRQASDIILLKFEKPANQGESVQVKRATKGQEYYNLYAQPQKVEVMTSMAQLVKIETFVKELKAALDRKDGYIMSSYGQNPKTGYLDLSITTEKSAWKPTGWYYTQYSGSQKEKALYWRDHATRVWDCNGLAEGIYEILTGKNINQRARNNYNTWCDPKGVGTIPGDKRVPGAAVFWGNSASTISHVAYLYKPVKESNPQGDWYLIEARGVAYGVVMTKLSTRKPKFWGWMTKYFDYSGVSKIDITPVPTSITFGNRTLKKGMKGDDVIALQNALMKLGFNLPKYGADGDYGNETIIAVKAFQKKYNLTADGVAGPKTFAQLKKLL